MLGPVWCLMQVADFSILSLCRVHCERGSLSSGPGPRDRNVDSHVWSASLPHRVALRPPWQTLPPAHVIPRGKPPPSSVGQVKQDSSSPQPSEQAVPITREMGTRSQGNCLCQDSATRGSFPGTTEMPGTLRDQGIL